MSLYDAAVEWTLSPDDDFASGHYSRGHAVSFDGGASFRGSSSPSVVPRWSDPAGVDPEEMLVASLSSCHMLWFLDLARRDGWVVGRYRDNAQGTMGVIDGKTGLVRCALRPRVDFVGDGPDAARLAQLHHRAHGLCFIANSVKGEVVVEADGEAAA